MISFQCHQRPDRARDAAPAGRASGTNTPQGSAIGMHDLTPPISRPLPRRATLVRPLLFLPLVLTACSNTRDVYTSGPWGPPRPRDAATTPYSGPWNSQPYQPVAAPYSVPAAPAGPSVRVLVEPMEPIGPWAKRRVTSTMPNGENAASEYASPPAAQEPVSGQKSSAPPAPDAKPVASAVATRRPEKRLTSMTGNWTVQASGGASCRLHLSSVAALDLYKASTAQCADKALQNVNAWNLRDGVVVLYSQGSAVLQARGDGNVLHGALEGTTILVKLSR